jgi:hypothetical protein
MTTKNIFAILILLTTDLFSQDTTVTWLRNIDTTDFGMYFNKKTIPKDLLKYIEVDNLNEIANPGKEYSAGCVRQHGTPYKRLNWIAKDHKNHLVVSISHGGKFHRTCFYYLDRDNKKTNINELSFGHRFSTTINLNFGATTVKIKRKEFEFEEYYEPNIDEK